MRRIRNMNTTAFTPGRAAGLKQVALAMLLGAALPAGADVTRTEPTLSDVTRTIVADYLQDRCGAAFGEDRGAAPLDREDRLTWLRCLWLRDSQARLSSGIRPDRTLTEWSARTGITENTSAARLSDAWFHPSFKEHGK
ncbi:MAG: hypothetical protein E6559_00385 [Pantoea sp.]|uniref:hypothetical protein n=2 Tax=Enterobacterales TaxID=91347 RepID=UPI00289B88FD|nr:MULTISPECIES: hypothetical protein [Pantoea]MDU5836271.1 hypothetical protein [Pantoea sp.]MDU6438367.1 hypothetical protein [Pantoea sp.]